MADSARCSSALPARPDTKAANLLWDKLSSNVMYQTKTPSPKTVKAPKRASRKRKKPTQSNNLNRWISTSDIRDLKENRSSKSQKKPKLKRFGSGSSEELPSFDTKKTKKKSYKETESFKRYGVRLPSVDEILKDREQFIEYKRQVELAQTLEMPSSINVTFSPVKEKPSKETSWLDCKHLSDEVLKRHFKKNRQYLADIMSGAVFSDRHCRYQDKNRSQYELTTRSLTYNTSMIIFTFEQIDYMLSLMRDRFDPDDNKTDYFFKVLVPEFCLKVFMETYGFDKKQALEYLDKRPVD